MVIIIEDNYLISKYQMQYLDNNNIPFLHFTSAHEAITEMMEITDKKNTAICDLGGCVNAGELLQFGLFLQKIPYVFIVIYSAYPPPSKDLFPHNLYLSKSDSDSVKKMMRLMLS